MINFTIGLPEGTKLLLDAKHLFLPCPSIPPRYTGLCSATLLHEYPRFLVVHNGCYETSVNKADILDGTIKLQYKDRSGIHLFNPKRAEYCDAGKPVDSENYSNLPAA